MVVGLTQLLSEPHVTVASPQMKKCKVFVQPAAHDPIPADRIRKINDESKVPFRPWIVREQL